MEQEDIIRISEDAKQRMKEMVRPGQFFHIIMENHSWSGPEFRLVESDSVADNEIAFTTGDLTVYLEKESLPYADYLDIVLRDTYGESSLLVEENII